MIRASESMGGGVHHPKNIKLIQQLLYLYIQIFILYVFCFSLIKTNSGFAHNSLELDQFVYDI